MSTATKAFMAWFGPKRVATMAYSILILGRQIPSAPRIFDLAALVVFCSIIVQRVRSAIARDLLGPAEARAAG